MKILVIGDYYSDLHEKAFNNAFKQLGINTLKFEWQSYFKDYLKEAAAAQSATRSVFYRFQNKYLLGPVIKRINSDLMNYVEEVAPDLVFIYRGTHILPSTVDFIGKRGCRIFGYNNDDPFSEKQRKYVWRHYLKSVTYYDWVFAYRKKNIDDYRRMGFHNVSLLKPYYIKEKNFPIGQLGSDKYVSDVAFIGHYEDDGRDEYIKSILESNISFNLYGTEWHRSRHYDFFRQKLGDIFPVREDYNLALNSTKIALVFLSKLNNDTYTRRCFEIPAAKTFMLSEYAGDMDSMFKEGIEAEYFRSPQELVDKIIYYLNHYEEREKIAGAGYRRVVNDGHEVVDRAKEVIKIYENLMHS